MTSGRRRAVASAGLAAAVITAVPALAACEAGQQAETFHEHFGDGAYVMTPDRRLMLSNVYLIPPGNQHKIHGTGLLYATITNLEMVDEQLTGIESPGRQISVQVGSASGPAAGSLTAAPSATAAPATTAAPSATATPSGSFSRSGGLPSPAQATGLPVTIPAGGGVSLGPDTGNPLSLSGLPDLFPGQLITLTFYFQNIGFLTVTTPVNEDTGTKSVFTSVSASPVTVLPESIDPSFLQQPYDDQGTTITPTGPQPEPPKP